MRYLYIGEIAELLGVSKDTIRIYEEQGLIFPVRDENGFRRYTEEDPDRIICYLNAEYDLKKSLEKPERCYLLIKEPEARYLGRQDLMEMSERIEGGSMVRAIQHTEKLFPDGELLAAAARWAGERGIALLEHVDVPVDLHDALVELPGVAGKIPGVVPLDPAGAHDAVVAEVVPLVVFPEPVIAVVGAVAVLVLVPLGGADPSGGQGGNGVCRRQGQG